MPLAVAAALMSGAWTGVHDDPLTKPLPANPDWVKPQAPLKLYANTYFVGTGGLSIVLIDTGDGLILVDGALPQTVAMTEANIRKLGFRVEDIRFILNTEAHFDHAGGLAALARDSGAQVITSPIGAAALRAGLVAAGDPQESDISNSPPVPNARGIADGEVLRLGNTAVTAVFTPGHTPGSVSWTWKSCEGEACVDVVFASSLNAVAARPFTYTGHPEVTAGLRASIDRMEGLDCGLLISAHPDNSGGDRKIAALEAGATPNPFLDPTACRAYAERARGRLQARLDREAAP
ncbi:subclass B3 metallo-beta-lactamase [Brevundimonas nasdae]|uniref:Subclass B3 metallo-beta-lactamase n=1 Tax=Brevundimonas nasdae TaxID=172043 RepID=A0ABX8TJY4_9CAUL|nr:subclass B3 metallo-beta-lactamase [Brevundimonas nasdae]QYC10989.1 subclass B3 metallo-beta-lactamase [Brevundimonas nasdae]QYC13775.1 subclass B3 metallo-beta-lactamase [Brevundimonas nasdae]